MKNKPWFAHYDEGVPREISIPRISLVDLYHEAVLKFGDSTCTICDSEAFSYRQIDDFSNRFASYLLDKGLQKGDRVGISLPNSTSFVIAYYGILKAGGVVMALNPAYRIPEIDRLSAESEIKFLVLPETVYGEIKSIQRNTQIEKLVVVGSRLPGLSADDIAWEQLIKAYAGAGPIDVQVSPDDPAIFQYSGGTTGTPKCAIGLHRNLVANVYQFNQWLVNTEPGKETVLVAIPIYHVYGQDEETLAFVISQITNQHGIKIGVLEYGLDGKFTEQLKLGQPDQLHASILNEKPENIIDFERTLDDFKEDAGCDVWLGIAVNLNEANTAHLYFQNSRQKVSKTRKYGGPKEYIPLWAQNIGLDFLRRQLITSIKNEEIGEK